ncbi:TPA: hypothetical protein ACKQBZ_000594 [Stenotrophomonas maltophilia]
MDAAFHLGQLVMVKEDPDVWLFAGEIARVSVLDVPCMGGVGMEVVSDHLGRFKGTYEQFEPVPEIGGRH